MNRRWIGVGIPWAFLLICGCGSSSKPTGEAMPAEPIASCESFASRFERCQTKLGASGDVVAERSATTRETLRVQTEGAKTEAARAALDAQCASGLKQLEAVCP